MKRRRIIWFFLFFILSGFSIFPEDENKLPSVVANYRVQITDTEGYSMELTNVSINNLLYISGKHSKGDIIIDFKDVDKIIFKNVDEKKVEAAVYMKNNESLNVILNGNIKLKGKSKYGIFSIMLRDLKEIKILEIINKK